VRGGKVKDPPQAHRSFAGVWGRLFKKAPKMRTAVRRLSYFLLPQEAGIKWHRRYAAAITLKVRSWSSALPAFSEGIFGILCIFEDQA